MKENKPTTSKPPGFFKKVIIKFINNENKRQEIFLILYCLFLFCFNVFIYQNFYPHVFAVSILIALYLLLTYSLKLFTAFEPVSDYFMYIFLSFLFVWLPINLYLENFRFIFGVLFLGAFIFVKSKVRE
jgi:hypothetical protein